MSQNFFGKSDAADGADLVYKMVSQCCERVKHFFSIRRRPAGGKAAAALRPAPPAAGALQLESGRLVKGSISETAGVPDTLDIMVFGGWSSSPAISPKYKPNAPEKL